VCAVNLIAYVAVVTFPSVVGMRSGDRSVGPHLPCYLFLYCCTALHIASFSPTYLLIHIPHICSSFVQCCLDPSHSPHAFLPCCGDPYPDPVDLFPVSPLCLLFVFVPFLSSRLFSAAHLVVLLIVRLFGDDRCSDIP